MSKAQISQLYSSIIKTHRVGKVLNVGDCEMVDALRELVNNKHCYGPIKITNLNVGKRKVKCLAFQSSKGYYPITKSKMTGKKEGPRAKTIRLMREAIENQIIDFREAFKQNQVDLIQSGRITEARKLAKCPLTGKFLNKVHVDHVVPFIRLADIWLETHTLYDKFSQVKPKDMASWTKFHEKYAVLALVGAKANMAKGSEGYRSVH